MIILSIIDRSIANIVLVDVSRAVGHVVLRQGLQAKLIWTIEILNDLL